MSWPGGAVVLNPPTQKYLICVKAIRKARMLLKREAHLDHIFPALRVPGCHQITHPYTFVLK